MLFLGIKDACHLLVLLSKCFIFAHRNRDIRCFGKAAPSMLQHHRSASASRGEILVFSPRISDSISGLDRQGHQPSFHEAHISPSQQGPNRPGQSIKKGRLTAGSNAIRQDSCTSRSPKKPLLLSSNKRKRVCVSSHASPQLCHVSVLPTKSRTLRNLDASPCSLRIN